MHTQHTCLLIEGSPTNRGPFAERLREEGYDVTVAESREHGIELLKEQTFNRVCIGGANVHYDRALQHFNVRQPKKAA